MAGNLKLKVLGLPGRLAEKLSSHNIITVQDFTALTVVELLRKTGLTYQKITAITELVNKFVAPKPIQVSQLDQPSHVMFGDELDLFLGGGVQCGQITEFSGAPGLGKTQLCFQLALSACLRDKDKGVLYIDSEGAFSGTRLLELALHKYKISAKEEIQDCLRRIHVWRPESLKDIIEKMINIEVKIIKERIALVIIDSMGSIVRRQFGAEKSIERGAQMCALSSSLKRVAHEHNIAVVVTNHVTFKMNAEEASNVDVGMNTSVPALGPSWSHWINSRLHLSIHDGTRRIVVAKSPELPELEIAYHVSRKGIEYHI